jgi:predicted  nucleic acid-binding Zn-ribbon protein
MSDNLGAEDQNKVIENLKTMVKALELELHETQNRLNDALVKSLQESERYEQKINQLNHEIQCAMRKM